MAHPFPLFRLPYLALDKCIKLNEIGDQFALSKVSNRSQRVVKCVLRKRKYAAVFGCYMDELTVKMRALKDESFLTLLSLNASTDMDLIKNSISQLTNTFAVEKILINFWKRDMRLITLIISFVKQQGVPYDVILGTTDDGGKMNDEICKYALKECGDAKTLCLEILTTPEFSPNPDDFGPFQCNLLSLYNSSWITLEHIIKWFINCNQIIIYDCKFTPTEINRLLKTWQKGSKIESLALLSWKLSVTLEGVLEGIRATPARAVSVRQEYRSISGLRSGFIIQQGSGQQAFVHLDGGNRIFLSIEFELEKEDK